MTKELFSREASYGAAMTIAKRLLSEGLITDREYCKIDTKFRRKFVPIIGGLKLEKT
ncbi:hypothetical protein FACS1894217_12250 [Clostridia bacterium]|nr:hypothetical protein FACS1894202_07830 [Clostridia bacterium]GHV08948.1 hypothetical protein FACS1894217_12250 [Clostridia bacterium]GHV18659.1 hypothetical protein FACS189425_07860 [Clostridia bacterium]GHV37043.1 hypothetical protein FACS18949_17090 [Clostridia bacterium]